MADVIPFPKDRAKVVRPVFPSITGSMTVDRYQMFQTLADRIFSETFADTAPAECLPTGSEGGAA